MFLYLVAHTVLRDAITKKAKPDDVVAALLEVEKVAKADPDAGQRIRDNLDGCWRLVFTTGTIDTQKKTGRVNYFPLKAQQCFDFATGEISNGIYVGDTSLVRFRGAFEFEAKTRKLEFDFDEITLFNAITINLKRGQAAEIGASVGLGAKNNRNLVANNKRPFFVWIDADDVIATARGGGGGLALWTRVT